MGAVAVVGALVLSLLSLSSLPAAAAPITLGQADGTVPCGTVNDWVQASSSAPGYELPAGVWRLTEFSVDRGSWYEGSLGIWGRRGRVASNAEHDRYALHESAMGGYQCGQITRYSYRHERDCPARNSTQLE